MLKTYALLSLLLLVSCFIGAQDKLPKFGKSGLPDNSYEIQRGKDYHNMLLKPDGLTNRFNHFNQVHLLSTQLPDGASDEQKKALLREYYGQSAVMEFNETISTGALSVLAASLLLCFLFRDRSFVITLVNVLCLSILSYLIVSYVGGSFGDFVLMLEVTWFGAIIGIIAILAVTGAFYYLLKQSKQLTLIQKIIILAGCLFGMAMLTNYLCTYTTGYSYTFFPEGYKMNYTASVFIGLLIVYAMFQPTSKVVQNKVA